MILPLLIALAVGYAIYQKSHPLQNRRAVTGKSGTPWFTASLPPDDGNTARVAVFATAHGEDAVLIYRQVVAPTAGVKVGDRLLEFQAPTAATGLAVSDFGPFLNQGKV